MDENESQSASGENSRVPGGDGVDSGPSGGLVIPADAGDDAAAAEKVSEPGASRGGTENQPGSDVSAQILALIQENHLHLPLLTPDMGKLERMREATPEFYQVYLEAVRNEIESAKVERTAPYLVPERYARRGQIFGLIATLVMMGVATYCVYLGSTVLAGVFGTIDLVALIAVFGANQKPQER